MSSISLEKFNLNDISRLQEIMELNKNSAGDRPKDWSNFVRWNIENENDPYWKIVLNEDCRPLFIGYIGYADASKKPTTKRISLSGDLFLEIYLHPEFVNKGYGLEAFTQSLTLIPKTARKIFASTYMSNTKAQSFFSSKLNMKISHYDKKYNVVVYVLELY